MFNLGDKPKLSISGNLKTSFNPLAIKYIERNTFHSTSQERIKNYIVEEGLDDKAFKEDICDINNKIKIRIW